MKFLFSAFFALLSIAAHTQYYYNDIVALQLSQQQYAALKNNNIKTVSAVSYESNNELTEDFKLQQQISTGSKSITIYASHPSSGEVITTNFYDNNKLTKTVDSSSNVVTTITYQYNDAGMITNILTQTDDAFMNSHSQELHQWRYNSNSKPEMMYRIKDNTDTTIIEFAFDEQGNVAQEDWKKKARIVESYYYYYNGDKQLTDIVRYNSKAKRNLPDFVYEYDTNGRIIQMTQFPSGSSDYMIWKYEYNSNNLKQRELLFTKQNQLVGRIEYKYE